MYSQLSVTWWISHGFSHLCCFTSVNWEYYFKYRWIHFTSFWQRASPVEITCFITYSSRLPHNKKNNWDNSNRQGITFIEMATLKIIHVSRREKLNLRKLESCLREAALQTSLTFFLNTTKNPQTFETFLKNKIYDFYWELLETAY